MRKQVTIVVASVDGASQFTVTDDIPEADLKKIQETMADEGSYIHEDGMQFVTVVTPRKGRRPKASGCYLATARLEELLKLVRDKEGDVGE